MRSDEEIRKSIFDDIVEILKHTIPKDSNVDPEAIASAVSTYLQNNPIEAGVPSENPVFTGTFSQNRKEGSTIGKYSYTEGFNGIASGNYSHAEGCNTSSSGDTSHAEGYGTSSGGMYSHAEGCNTSAYGNMSFAGGNRTKTTAAAQFAVGYGNDPQADSIFEVGNGLDADGNPNNAKYTEPATRQNAFRVTQGGVALAQTGLGIGNTSITEDQLIALINSDNVSDEKAISKIYDTSGFSKSSLDIAHEMLIGYNIGDYMDACNCRTWAYTIPDNVLDRAKYIETLWGNVRIGKDFIDYLASIGIQAIRLPITWMEFIDDNNNLISNDWLNRAEELITWIIESGMYCIINLHHDGLVNWEHTRRIILEDAYMNKSISYACNLWMQISEHFKDFGYKLLFETFNEVCDTSKSMTATQSKNTLAVRLNKVIIDTIRSTGGNNTNRFIGCAAYGGVSFLQPIFMNELREYDSATDKLLACSHQYPNGNANISSLNNGYGQYHGEIGWNPSVNRASYIQDLHDKVQTLKHPCFWWDNGARDFNLINRFYSEPSYKEDLEAYVGKTLNKETFTYPNMADGSQPYYAKFKTDDFDNMYGAKYVVITSSKPITEVKEATNTTSVGYYKFIGVENALITMYISNDDITYTRYITRIATEFSAIRDDFHILGSTSNTLLVDSNYTIDNAPKPIIIVDCTNITLDKSSIMFTTKDSQTIVATKEPNDCTKSVIWTSDNESIAVVNNGVVTPKSNGTCIITATCGDKTATCNIDTTGVDFSSTTTPEPVTASFEWNGEDTLPSNMSFPTDIFSITKSDDYGTYITSNTHYSKLNRMISIKETDDSMCMLNDGDYIEAMFVLLDNLTANTVNTRHYCGLTIPKTETSNYDWTIKGNGTNTDLKTLANIDENIGTRYTIRITIINSTNGNHKIEIINSDGNIAYDITNIIPATGSGIGRGLGVYVNSSVGVTRIKVVKNS